MKNFSSEAIHFAMTSPDLSIGSLPSFSIGLRSTLLSSYAQSIDAVLADEPDMKPPPRFSGSCRPESEMARW
jgi:hypothetical protein